LNLNRLKLLYLLHLSRPSADRLVYRSVRRQHARRIVEVGIGTARRALRLIQVAGGDDGAADIQYTGIDLFEDRSEADGEGLSLKEAHRLLKATGARVRLVPGDPETGLSSVANALGKVDLLLLSPRPDAGQLGHAWFFIPRLLHPRTLVFLESFSAEGLASLRRVDPAEIHQRAGAIYRRAA
jgi:hypothetical protein